MKDKWKICEDCVWNGHCENQDRDIKCETYPKKLEDRITELEKQVRDYENVLHTYAKYRSKAKDVLDMWRRRNE